MGPLWALGSRLTQKGGAMAVAGRKWLYLLVPAAAEGSRDEHQELTAIPVVIPAPAIVDDELWQKANAAIDERKFHSPSQPRSQRRPYGLGSGRVRHIHEDGSSLSMTGAPRTDRKWNGEQVTQRDYRCTANFPPSILPRQSWPRYSPLSVDPAIFIVPSPLPGHAFDNGRRAKVPRFPSTLPSREPRAPP